MRPSGTRIRLTPCTENQCSGPTDGLPADIAASPHVVTVSCSACEATRDQKIDASGLAFVTRTMRVFKYTVVADMLIQRLGRCFWKNFVNRRGVPTPIEHAKLLIHLAMEGSLLDAYSHPRRRNRLRWGCRKHADRGCPGIDRALIVKVLGPQGAPTEAVVLGLEWALKKRADIISMSLGIDFPALVDRLVDPGYPPKVASSRALAAYRSTIRLFDRLSRFVDARAAKGRGALLVAASGNESLREQDPRYTVAVAPPAAGEGFISLGAINSLEGQKPPYVISPF